MALHNLNNGLYHGLTQPQQWTQPWPYTTSIMALHIVKSRKLIYFNSNNGVKYHYYFLFTIADFKIDVCLSPPKKPLKHRVKTRPQPHFRTL